MKDLGIAAATTHLLVKTMNEGRGKGESYAGEFPSSSSESRPFSSSSSSSSSTVDLQLTASLSGEYDLGDELGAGWSRFSRLQRAFLPCRGEVNP